MVATAKDALAAKHLLGELGKDDALIFGFVDDLRGFGGVLRRDRQLFSLRIAEERRIAHRIVEGFPQDRHPLRRHGR